jgi:hypothetical protein
MRRTVLTAPVVALAVAALAGCDERAEPVPPRATVAVGSLPAELPVTVPLDVTQATVPASSAVASSSSPTTSPPASTTAPDPDTRFVEVLGGLVEGEIPGDVATTTARDGTGRLRIAVPRSWTDRRTEPAVLADGSDTPSLAASPDLTAFLDGYEMPGLTALVVTDRPVEALGAYEFGEDCLNRRRGPYRGPAGEGRYEVWESCGGTVNDIVTLAVRVTDADATVLLLVQVVDAEDLVALDAALDSLQLRR